MKNNDTIARNTFQERIRKGLLGPGSDIYVDIDEANEEIISDYPLQRYYTGVLFPEKRRVNSLTEEADNEVKNETDNEEYEKTDFEKENPTDENEDMVTSKAKEMNEDDELKISQSTFFPTNIGLTFCIDKTVKEIEVKFSFGLYSQIAKDIKIKTPKEVYEEFVNHPTFPFKEIIDYQKGYLILKRKLKGKSRQPRTEEFALLDEFKKSNEFKGHSIKYKFRFFEKLIGRTWKRENVVIKETIPILDIEKPKTVFERNLTKTKENFLRVSYTVKTYNIPKNPECTYVKIQLANTSDKHPSNQFPNAKELLNNKCIFQAKIKADIPDLKPYKSYLELNPLDEEAEVLNYLYKDKYSYGIGHNCSVEWDNENHSIQTTFLPQYDVKDTKNTFSEEDFENASDYLTLRIANKIISRFSLFSWDS